MWSLQVKLRGLPKSAPIPVRAMQQVEHLIYRDFLPKDRGKWDHGWPTGAINQILNRSNRNYCEVSYKI